MFVMNPCHNDARVRKQAAALGAAGYTVRIFALGNSVYGPAVIDEGNFTIRRLAVQPPYQRSLAALVRITRVLRGRQGGMDSMGPTWRSPAGVVLMAPLTILAGLARGVGMAWMLIAAIWHELGRLLRRGIERLRCRFDMAPDSPLSAGADTSIPAPLLKGLRLIAVGCRAMARYLRVVRSRLRRWARHGKRRAKLGIRRLVRAVVLPMHRPLTFYSFWRVSGDAALAWRPDIVHAHDFNALPGAARLARKLGAQLVYDSHELWRRRNRHGSFRPLGRSVDALLERRLIRRADLVITVSPSIATWLQRRYRLPILPTVIRNLPPRRGARTNASLRELADLDSERILLYTGRITSGRGLDEAMEALPGLPSDVVIVMLGYGDVTYVARLRERARQRGLEDRVRLVPAVPPDQVAATAAEADVSLVAIQPVCLSYRFSLPNKLFEAIQAGVPVLASNLPDMADVVHRYKIGALFEPGNAEQLRQGLLHLLAHADEYRKAADLARRSLCWEEEVDAFLTAYEAMQSEGSRHSLSSRPVSISGD